MEKVPWESPVTNGTSARWRKEGGMSVAVDQDAMGSK
jgi:hypothetical protein